MQKNLKLTDEFDRQIENLIEKDYPKAAGLTTNEFKDHLSPLKKQLKDVQQFTIDLNQGILPFVIVVKNQLIEAEKTMTLVKYNGKEGIVKTTPKKPSDFMIIDIVKLPNSLAYLLVDIDRGKQTLNITPENALKILIKENRSPLTVDEGIAIITHYPEFLIKNNCFSLIASRINGSQMVPAIWINGLKQANLGWCWDRNPHTWLGSASCATRFGSDKV